MIKHRLFPRGIASKSAFCNRAEEIKRIASNIMNLTHSMLMSPRRYGKTSLALRAIEDSKLPYAHIDLFMKYDPDVIYDEFYEGMSTLISKIIKPTEKAIRKIESFIKNVSISLKLGRVGLEFSMAPKSIISKRNLKTLLVGIDQILAQNKKRAVIFIDEIQTITETEIWDEVESSLRFVAQKTENIAFIFSGSNRHLMKKIFDDSNRPFYKLCQKIPLQRISHHHYKLFINKLAQQQWKQSLSIQTIDDIMLYTKRHPYYVNVLCSSLFEQNNLPNEEDVIKHWRGICYEEQGTVARDIEFLTPKQKRLLGEIAKHPKLMEPTSKNFLKNVNLTARGVSQAMKTLLKHDLIERLEETGEYRVVDPVIEYWFL